LKKEASIVELAKKLFYDIKDRLTVVYDDTAAIGKLYRRQDEIGTPFCITVDTESVEDKKVTIRERDSMQQERVAAESVLEFLNGKLATNG